MPQKYSPQRRRYQAKADADLRKLIKTLVILIGTCVFVLFVGIPLVAKMGGVISKFFQGNNSVIATNKDSIAPQPPYIESLPQGTNQQAVNIKGLAEPGSKVTLIFNKERSKEVLADGGGGYEFESITLKEGENTITVTATDDAGNESEPSQETKIVYKMNAPKLEIAEPLENQILTELDNPVKIAGKTDQHTRVYVNETLSIVDSEGNYEKYLVLKDEGVNVIKLKAVDIAGNITEKELKVVFNRTD